MFRSIAFRTTLGSCLLATPGAADVLVPVSHDRWIGVHALAVDLGFPESDEVSDSLTASTFGVFQADTTVAASVMNAVATCSAAQMSQILAASIVATGSMSASGDGYDYEARGTANGASQCDVTFNVNEHSLFTLSGSLTAAGTAVSGVTLDGPSGTVAMVTGGANQTTPVLATGVLMSGTYSLSASVSGSAIGDFFVYVTGSASYDISLSLTSITGAPLVGTALPRATPNPFREITWIRGSLPGGQLTISDVHGRLIRRLALLSDRGAIPWDGRDGRGRSVPPGVYFVRHAGDESRSALKVTRLR